MNGAESVVATLVSGGVEVCFTNPGTSEMHLVAALDKQPHLRCVLGLFEGVVTAAADGYARMAGKSACTLLHLGPGFANGIANLHNAWRAHSPIVNLIGQHALSHLAKDTPLKSDIEGLARPYSHWLRTSLSAAEVGIDAAAALAASLTAPGQIATLIVPVNVAWDQGGQLAAIPAIPTAPLPSQDRIEHAAKLLRSGWPTAVLLSGNVLYGKGLRLAGDLASSTNAVLLVPYPFSRLERGAGRPIVDRIPYVPQQAIALLKPFRQLILVGAAEPLAYFASPSRSAVLVPPDCEIYSLATPSEDCVGAMEAVLALCNSPSAQRSAEPANRPPFPSGSVTSDGLAAAIAASLPENAIVVDESMSTGRGIMSAARGAPPHDWLANTGGSIGIALPLAVGAAVARKDRPVLCLSADGSSMYTLQALWTMAREGLHVTTIIFNNRAYGVLQREFANACASEPGPTASSLFDLGSPDLDWVALSQGMGVPAAKATSLEEVGKLLCRGFQIGGPSLIEVFL